MSQIQCRSEMVLDGWMENLYEIVLWYQRQGSEMVGVSL